MYSFDEILDNKIRTGPFQFKTVSLLGLIEFCDGIEYLFMTILMTILQKEWDLTKLQLSTLGSSFFLGILCGNLFCAAISDIIGRKLTFQIFSGLSVVAIYATSVAVNYNQIVILRFLFGTVYGTTTPLGYVLLSEISVSRYRGRIGLILTLLFVSGKIYLVILCYIFLEDYSTGNWRGLIRFNGLPVIAAFVFSLIILRDSARFHLSRREFVKAFEEIEHCQIVNHGTNYEPLTQDEKDGLIMWQQHIDRINQRYSHKGEGILSKKFLKTTLLLWGIIILVNFQNMAVYLLMPFLFQSSNSGFGAMLYLFIAELIISILIYNFIDDPKYGGRIKILLISAALLTITNLGLYVFKQSLLFIGMLIIKLGTRAIFSISFIVTCESFPINLRSRSFGIAQGVGKLATIPAPYILFPLYYIDEYLPFSLLAILSLIQIMLVCIYPYDRTQKPLEIADNDSNY